MFSQTSIADFLACRHLTALNRAAAAGELKKPKFADPGLELLIKLGAQHEEAYLRELTEAGLQIATIPIATWNDPAERTGEALRASRAEAVARTIEAMRAGVDVIYQAVFLHFRLPIADCGAFQGLTASQSAHPLPRGGTDKSCGRNARSHAN